MPVGLHLARSARVVGRAFDDALAAAGGSLPVWLILLNLEMHPRSSQRELAEALGVREATVTHHRNAMEGEGLLTRRRDPENRRVHIVEPTEAGRAQFGRLREVAIAFDGRLRGPIPAPDLAVFARVLDRLVANAGDGAPAPWPGLDETRPPRRRSGPPTPGG